MTFPSSVCPVKRRTAKAMLRYQTSEGTCSLLFYTSTYCSRRLPLHTFRYRQCMRKRRLSSILPLPSRHFVQPGFVVGAGHAICLRSLFAACIQFSSNTLYVCYICRTVKKRATNFVVSGIRVSSSCFFERRRNSIAGHHCRREAQRLKEKFPPSRASRIPPHLQANLLGGPLCSRVKKAGSELIEYIKLVPEEGTMLSNG